MCMHNRAGNDFSCNTGLSTFNTFSFLYYVLITGKTIYFELHWWSDIHCKTITKVHVPVITLANYK